MYAARALFNRHAPTWALTAIDDNPTSVVASCTLAVFIAAVVTFASRHVTRVVRRIHMPISDAYREGFDAGHDKGWRECEAHHSTVGRRVVQLVRANGTDQQVTGA